MMCVGEGAAHRSWCLLKFSSLLPPQWNETYAGAFFFPLSVLSDCTDQFQNALKQKGVVFGTVLVDEIFLVWWCVAGGSRMSRTLCSASRCVAWGTGGKQGRWCVT